MKNPSRGYRAGRSRRNFLKGAGALGLTLAAAGGARGTSASVVVINENGTVSTSTNPAAAQWVSPSAFVASSLETGRIGYIVAWGGNEYGYAYTYALSGAPAGVTIDVDTGILSIGSPLSPRAYSFSVRVTNREVVSNVATFPITLTVVQGVTALRTGNQILHKTYDPLSGAYGTPIGNNYTAVLNKIQATIKADQVAAGEERLRATIIFRRGVQYDYTNNHWLTGLQYFTVRDDPAHPTGALPNLRNITYDTVYEAGPLNIGQGGAINHQDNPPGIKSFCALLNSAAVGASVVTLKKAADASKIKAGRWHVVMCGCHQIGGFPPNVTYFDYVKVVAVSGATITLDRRLRYRYSDTFYENVRDDQSFGRAWIVPWDMGGTGGAVPSDPRLTIRGRFLNINFQTNPKNGGDICLMQGFIDMSFENCTIPNLQPTMSKHVLFLNCRSVNSGEPDKIIESIVFDGGTTGELGGGTGAQYWLSRNVKHGCIQVSPRQFRSLGSTFDAAANTYLSVPFSVAYNGPVMYYHFKKSTFKPGPNGKVWTWSNPPYSPIRIGSDARWSGTRLIIPSSFAKFGDWLNALYEGVILTTTGKPPPTSNWGYVRNLSSPGDGSALWADIVWVAGAQPTSGNIYPNGRFRRLNFEADNVFVAPMSWLDPSFMKQTIPPALRPSYGFPAAYPLQYP
jgi:hypothetical protein